MANWKSNEYNAIADSSSAYEYLSNENALRALAMGKDIVGTDECLSDQINLLKINEINVKRGGLFRDLERPF